MIIGADVTRSDRPTGQLGFQLANKTAVNSNKWQIPKEPIPHEHVEFWSWRHFIEFLEARHQEPVDLMNAVREQLRAESPNTDPGKRQYQLEKYMRQQLRYFAQYTLFGDRPILWSEAPYKGGFNASNSFQHAFDLARFGWSAGREKVAEAQAEVKRIMHANTMAPMPVLSFEGQEVDVARYLAGDPEHMLSLPLRERQDRALELTVNIDSRCNVCDQKSCDFKPVELLWRMLRGAIVANMTQMLTMMGHQVNVRLTSVSMYQNRKPKLLRTMSIPLYRAGEVFDYDRIIFGVSHDGMSRRLQFRAEEILNVEHMRNELFRTAEPTIPLKINMRRTWEAMSVGTLPVGHSHNELFNPDEVRGDFVIEGGPQQFDAGLLTEDARETAVQLLTQLHERGVVMA